MKIKIDKEFETLIPDLTSDEYNQLEQNILKDGCRDPLILWNNILIDGHNRYKICNKHNINFKTININFNTRSEATEYIILNQFGRRNITTEDRCELAFKLEDVIKEKAKDNLIKSGGDKKSKKFKENSFHQMVKPDKIESIHTDKKLAEIAGVGSSTIHRARVVKKEATEEQKQQIKEGNTTINKIYTKLRPPQNQNMKENTKNKITTEPPKQKIQNNKSQQETQEQLIPQISPLVKDDWDGESNLKRCVRCGLVKPIDHFYTHNDKHRPMCKKCYNNRDCDSEPLDPQIANELINEFVYGTGTDYNSVSGEIELIVIDFNKKLEQYLNHTNELSTDEKLKIGLSLEESKEIIEQIIIKLGLGGNYEK